jgi:hypothetical protein
MVTREHANVGRVYVRVQYLPDADDVGAVPTGAVGTAAYSNADAFATAAQGALADTAVQPAHTGVLTITQHNNSAAIDIQSFPEESSQSPTIRFDWNSDTLAPYDGENWLGFVHVGPESGNQGSRLVIYDTNSQFVVSYREVLDSLHFLAGTHYLSPSGSGSSLTSLDLNPSLTATVAKAAAALTNITTSQIVAAGGVTNFSTEIWDNPPTTGTVLTNVSLNGTLLTVVNGVATGTVASGSGGSSVTTNWIDATAIGVGAETVFPTYNIRTNANGSMYVLAFDKTVENSWAGPFVIVPLATNITTFWQGYHSTTGTTAIAFRWRSGLNAWSTVTTSSLQNATGSLTNLDTLSLAVSGLTALVPIEAEITTISTNSGTSAGYHYLKAWGWTP